MDTESPQTVPAKKVSKTKRISFRAILAVIPFALVVILATGLLFAKPVGQYCISNAMDILGKLNMDDVNPYPSYLKYPSNSEGDVRTPTEHRLAFERNKKALNESAKKIEKAQTMLNIAKLTSFSLNNIDKAKIEPLQNCIDATREMNTAIQKTVEEKNESLGVVNREEGNCASNIDYMQFCFKRYSENINASDFKELNPAYTKTSRDQICDIQEKAQRLAQRGTNIDDVLHLMDKLNQAYDILDAIYADATSNNTEKLATDIAAFNAIYQTLDFEGVKNNLSSYTPTTIMQSPEYANAYKKLTDGLTRLKEIDGRGIGLLWLD